MSVFVHLDGVWGPAVHIGDRHGGANRRFRRGWERHDGVWRKIFQDEVVVTLASKSTYTFLKSLFSADDWANPLLRKRVIIPEGVEHGTDTSFAIAPLSTADGQAASFAGELIVDNHGTISGLGGAANSGVGGTAVYGNLPGRDGQKLILNNYGTIRAGGGGGGEGGDGGGGSYSSPYTYAENAPQTPTYSWTYKNGYVTIRWASATIGTAPSSTGTVSIGGWLYYRGNMGGWAPEDGGTGYYLSKRTQTRYQTINTNGGAGGNGGRGQGCDGAAAAGANGAAGGTNAGTGGMGGTGGAWGASGGTGATGSNGNRTNGLAGAAGGLAGYYLNGADNVTLNNFGTLQGRLAA